jgi:flagellar biosynthetic protein FliO
MRIHLFCIIVLTACGAFARGESAALPPPVSAAVTANVPPDGATSEAPRLSTPSSALGEQPIRATPSQDVGSAAATTAAGSQGMDYPRVLAALGIVIALILVLRWFGKYFFPTAPSRGSSRAVEVISRSPLSPKQQIVLIRVGRRLVVVGDSGSQMNPLCEISDPDEIAALVGQLRDEKTSPTTRAFGAMFGKSRQQFDRSAEDLPAEEQPAPLTEADEDQPITSARDELNGLRDRVRMLAQQFKDSA